MNINTTSFGKQLLALLIFTLAILTFPILINHVQATEPSQSSPYEADEYIIKLKSPSRARVMSQLDNHTQDVSLLQSNRQHFLVKLPANPDEDLLKSFASDPNVEYIEPNLRMRKATAIFEPRYAEQWGLQAIQAPQAWEEADGAAQVIVAVLDTGVDYTHPDLINRVDAQSGYDYVNDDFDAMDDEGHGTHVAGIIAAELNNIGIAGVSGGANVKILPLKVLDNQGDGTMYDVSFAIMDAVDKGADVINLSMSGERGKDEPKMLQEAISYALDHDVAVIAAAGNDGGRVERYLPASIPGVIAVSAVDEELELAKFSNYGSGISFAAPGEEILSTALHGRYVYVSGTSQAAPFVSGTVALLKAAEPQLGVQEIEDRLRQAATDLGKKGRDEQYGYGLINAYRALHEEVDSAAPRSISVDPGKLSLRPGSTASLRVTAKYDDKTVRDVTDRVVWQADNESIATVDRGEVRGQAFGKTQIIASYGGKKFVVPVELVVSRLEVSEPRITLKPDEAVSLIAYATYGDRTKEELAPADVRWTSFDEAVATVKNGVVTAQSTGSTLIMASYGGNSVTIKVQVKMTMLTMEPDKIALVPDASYSVTLYAHYGAKLEVVTDEADWQTSNDEVAVIEDGVITATGTGIAWITADYRGKSVTIRVDSSVKKLEIPETDMRMQVGESDTPLLFATYQNGFRDDVTEKGKWQSSNEQVAIVDEQGKITAIKEGTVSITASYGGRNILIRLKVRNE